jgi:alkyl sulfatase BDS1-like metallo-beta-lactamase superfamily hydrolase
MSDAINAMIQSAIASLKKLELSELTSFGRDKLTIRHASGGTIQFRNDGKVYYNGTEIGTGSGSLWQDDAINSHAELVTPDDISLNGFDIKDISEIKGTSTGNLVLTIDDGYALVIQKTSL